MDNKEYCKVLLLGEPFNDYSGMGVTLTNLFKEWPTAKIAVCAHNLDVDLCEKIRPCVKYAALSKPSKLIKKRLPIVTYIRQLLGTFYSLLGLSDNKRIPISTELKKIISEFKPDIIFSALGSYDRMNYLLDVMDLAPTSKAVIYITDDWPNTRYDGRLFRHYWEQKYRKKFMEILQRSALNLSICQSMSDAYKSQYNYDFIPFHNPVDTLLWDNLVVERKYSTDITSIAYVGKINRDTRPCLLDLCKAVEHLNKTGHKIIFDIYSPAHKGIEKFRVYKHCHVYPPLPNDEIPCLLKGYDMLFLPLGFSKRSRRYTRLSMPTKLTEYMASGVPMLIYCPEEIALSKYASQNKFAFICNKKGDLHIRECLMNIIYQKKSIKLVVETALLAAKEHDVTIVREEFRKTLVNAL